MNLRRSHARTAIRTALNLTGVALLLVVAPGKIDAQQATLLSGFNPLGESRGGLHLYSVTGFAGWESVVSPQGGLFLPGGRDLQGDVTGGGAASVGWSRRGRKTNMSIQYNASYMGHVRYTNLSALSHFLTFGVDRHIANKWSVGFSGTSALSTYDQMLFSPLLFSSVVAVPGTFDDLASAVLAGKYTNDQLASLLTGAPLIESPARTLFFGDRVFMSSVGASLSYAHSPRLSISFTSNAGLSQHLNDRGERNAPQRLYLLPRAIEASAGTMISYALTPRTQVGVSASSNRGFSQFQDGFTTSASAFVGRTMGRHWFVQAHAGGGFVTSIRSKYASSVGTSPLVGGSLGYKLRAHSFLVASDRTLGQSYGVGAANMNTTTAAWNWQRPGRSWGLASSYMRQQFSNGPFNSLNGWRSSFGVNQRIGEHFVVETAYSYGAYSDVSTTAPGYNSGQHAIRVSMMWTPQGYERR